MLELKPCPFCGHTSPKITEKRSGNYRRTGDMMQVLCGKCKARGPIFTAAYIREGEYGRYSYKIDTDARNEANKKAVEAWNTRFDDPIMIQPLQVQLTEEEIQVCLKRLKQ